LARTASNVLVIPYFIDDQRNALFAVFLRSDMGHWQWIGLS